MLSKAGKRKNHGSVVIHGGLSGDGLDLASPLEFSSSPVPTEAWIQREAEAVESDFDGQRIAGCLAPWRRNHRT